MNNSKNSSTRRLFGAITVKDHDLTQLVEGKVIYLLALVLLVQTIYPITGGGSLAALLAYQLLYAALVVVGIVLARDTSLHTYLLIILGVLWGIGGALFAFNQDALWAQLMAYIALALFLGMIVQVMLRFIFNARRVTRDVLYAASAVYFLLGALFVPVYGLVDTITVAQTGSHAFSDALATGDGIFPWQTLIYYSYATLTTLGYGDILPLTMWARSLVSLEAIVGVLYTTVILARLVGLYVTPGNE